MFIFDLILLNQNEIPPTNIGSDKTAPAKAKTPENSCFCWNLKCPYEDKTRRFKA
jgi:hypothetical protein